MELAVRYHTEQEICATWGSIVVRICDGKRTDTDDLDRVSGLFDELLETHANIAILLISTHDTPPPCRAPAQAAARQLPWKLSGML